MPDDDVSPSPSVSLATVTTAEALPDVPSPRDDASLDAEVRAAMRPEPHDPRYPRTGRAKTLRWLLILPWLGFAAYLGYAAQQILPPIINGQPLSGNDLADDLLLGRLIPVARNAPLLAVVPPLIVLALLVLVSRVALRDARRERAFGADRNAWEIEYHRRLGALRDDENRRQAEAAHQRAEAARQQAEQAQQHAQAAHQRIDEVAQRGIGSALAPAGPPLDFSLLPAPEHFVGREADLAWVEQRLRQGGTSAIVAAIAGLGGIGKTALAAVAVRQLYAEGRFKDGIAVVSCLERNDAAGALRDVLLRFVPQDVPPEATLNDLATLAVTRLKDRDALVVLDNVEPELSLGDVLQPLRDAHLTVLLTARQTLPLPPGDRRALDLLSDAAALELFAEWYGRANAAALTPNERASAQRIVTALGRHTLAVKLAGAQAADLALPLDAFAAQVAAHPLDLEDQGADATLALKERLMRSVNALPTDGALGDVRLLFAALAAFAVPARDADDPDRVTLAASLEFGRHAAAAVAEALALPDPDRALDLLLRRALLDKHTDETLPADADRERLRLHPLLRELAAELLDDPIRAAASLAIARFYAQYANATPDAALVPDADNIAGALEWAHAHAPDEYRDVLVARICDGMRNFWRDRSRTRDSLRYLLWGCESLREAGRLEAYGYMLRDYAYAQQIIGEVFEAEQNFNRALQVFNDLGDEIGAARLSEMIGRVAAQRGNLEDAERLFREAAEVFRQTGDDTSLGIVLSSLGDIQLQRGDLAGAQANYERALGIMRAVGDTREEGVALSLLGDILVQRGDLAGAQANYERYRTIMAEVGDTREEGVALSKLGDILVQRGDLAGAQANYERYRTIMGEVGDTREEGVALGKLGDILVRRGDLAGAQANYERYRTIMGEVGDTRGEGEALNKLGQVTELRGDYSQAEGFYTASIPLRQQTQDRQGEAITLAQLGNVARQRSEPQLAETRYRQALTLLADVEDVANYAGVASALAQLLITQLDKRDEGCDLLRQAIAIYHQMGAPDEQRAREMAEALGCEVGE